MGDSESVTMEIEGQQQSEGVEEPVPIIPSEETDKTVPDFTAEEEETAEEDFVVLEEDDDGEEVEDEEKLLADDEFDKGEEEEEAVTAIEPNGEDVINEEEQEEEIILANPLFGVGGSQEEKVEEVHVDSSEMANGEVIGGEEEDDCTPACSNQKRMLVGEVDRLRKALGELGKRHSVLEDFIQVEYADKFARFLTNRDRLVSLGYGTSTEEEAEGQRGAKSKELVELLKMIKEQASATIAEQRHRSDPKSQQKSRGPTTPAPKGILKPPRKELDTKTKPIPNSKSSERKPSAASSTTPSKPATATPQKRPASSSTSSPDATSKKRKRNPRRGPNTGGAKRLCPICNEVVRLYVLREHLILVHQQMQLPCPICKVEYPAKNQLKGHMTSKHNLSEERALYYAGRAEGPLGPWLDGMVDKAKVPSEEQVKKYVEKAKNGRNQNERRPEQSSSSSSSSSRYYGGGGRGRRPAVSSSRRY